MSLGEELRRLAKENPDKLQEALSQLTQKEAQEILYDWDLWARDAQKYDPNSAMPITTWLMGRGAGKDLTDSTPIFTHNKGWATMGDIEVGDYVYDENGLPIKVLEKYKPPMRPLYRFYFSDGSSIVSSEEHEWVTLTYRDMKAFNRSQHESGPMPDDWPNWCPKNKRSKDVPKEKANGAIEDYENGMSLDNVMKKWHISYEAFKKYHAAGGWYEEPLYERKEFLDNRVKTTKEIIETFTHGKRGDLNHRIPLCKPLQGTYDSSIVDSYYLGYWLGDGFSVSFSKMACNEEDFENFKSLYPDFEHKGNCVAKSQESSKYEFIQKLGLVRNKHMPERCLSASYEQRLEILQGLMDSDGYVSDERGSVEFMNTNKSIAEGALKLARSLGQKASLSEGRATLYGKDCGPKYRVTWRPAWGIVPFKLPRKAERVVFDGLSQQSRTHQRMITDWEHVEWEPTSCIKVDSPNSLFLAGEALIPTHNTRSGSEAVRKAVYAGAKNIALVGPTSADVRDTMVLGGSGILNVFPPDERPIWEPSYRRVRWEKWNAQAILYSAEEPERLRGPNHDFFWLDEPGSFKSKEPFTQLMMTLRIGLSKGVVTGTPRANELVIDLYNRKDKDVKLITGSTWDNKENLSDIFINETTQAYVGTKLGEQELEGKLLLDNDGALWNTQLISNQTLKNQDNIPEPDRISIGVDPAMSSKKKSDLTGIVISMMGDDGYAYVLEDLSGKYTANEWRSKIFSRYDYWSSYCPVSIVVEKNQGGDLIEDTIKRDRPLIPVDTVFSTSNKMSRAEPISLLYEQGKIFHVKSFSELEVEMTTYEGVGKSPDRMDALVFSLQNLIGGKRKVTKVNEIVF